MFAHRLVQVVLADRTRKGEYKAKVSHMPAASAIRLQIESALAARIPAALTPAPRMVRPVAATGINALDEVVRGGLPVGALTELAGQECSGRTSVALKFVAGLTQAGKVCAWIDVSNALDPASAAAAGVDLERLLWVRCGAAKPATPRAQQRFSLPETYLTPAPAIKGLHVGGCGGHPRGEVKGLARAVSGLLHAEVPEANDKPANSTSSRRERQTVAPGPGSLRTGLRPWGGGVSLGTSTDFSRRSPAGAKEPPLRFSRERESHSHPETDGHVHLSFNQRTPPKTGIWAQLDQALRATDLVLQAGGFSAVVRNRICRLCLGTKPRRRHFWRPGAPSSGRRDFHSGERRRLSREGGQPPLVSFILSCFPRQSRPPLLPKALAYPAATTFRP